MGGVQFVLINTGGQEHHHRPDLLISALPAFVSVLLQLALPICLGSQPACKDQQGYFQQNMLAAHQKSPCPKTE